MKQPVLFPLVNAGDQSHLAVTLGSPVCDEGLVLKAQQRVSERWNHSTLPAFLFRLSSQLIPKGHVRRYRLLIQLKKHVSLESSIQFAAQAFSNQSLDLRQFLFACVFGQHLRNHQHVLNQSDEEVPWVYEPPPRRSHSLSWPLPPTSIPIGCRATYLRVHFASPLHYEWDPPPCASLHVTCGCIPTEKRKNPQISDRGEQPLWHIYINTLIVKPSHEASPSTLSAPEVGIENKLM